MISTTSGTSASSRPTPPANRQSDLPGSRPARTHRRHPGGPALPDSFVRGFRWRLNLALLLADFQDYFRQHSEHWEECYGYKEAGPQLLLQAFLQKAVNGGGRIEREYGLGRGRTDLLILWPQGPRVQRFAVKCKVLRRSLEGT